MTRYERSGRAAMRNYTVAISRNDDGWWDVVEHDDQFPNGACSTYPDTQDGYDLLRIHVDLQLQRLAFSDEPRQDDE